MWVLPFIKLQIPRCLHNPKVTPESHLFSRPPYSGKWPLHDQILFDAIMKTNECNTIIYWGVPQFQSWHGGELRCNPGNAKLCLSSLSTLSLAQIISSSSRQGISLLRASINQKKHGSICLRRMTDPSIRAHVKPYFIILFLDFSFMLEFTALSQLSLNTRENSKSCWKNSTWKIKHFSNPSCRFNRIP